MRSDGVLVLCWPVVALFLVILTGSGCERREREVVVVEQPPPVIVERHVAPAPVIVHRRVAPAPVVVAPRPGPFVVERRPVAVKRRTVVAARPAPRVAERHPAPGRVARPHDGRSGRERSR